MESKDELFSKMPVGRAILVLALPAIMGQLVSILYNLADTYFIAASNDGIQVAAVSLGTPVMIIISGIGNIFGFGGGTYIVRRMGEKDAESAKRASSYCFWAGLVVSLIIMAVGLIFLPRIAGIIGAKEDTFAYACDYLRVIFMGAPFMVISVTLLQMIRNEGASREGTAGMIAGTVLNIILDPIMITGLGWGVTGAAVATVLGNVLSTVIYFVYLGRKNTILSLSPKYFSLEKEMQKSVILIGIPSAMGPVLVSVSNILMNNLCVPYGSNAIAALGIASKMYTLVIMTATGLIMGAVPFIGYNYTAGSFDRMKRCVKLTGRACVIMGSAFTVFFLVFRHPLVNIFMDDPEITGLAAKFLSFITLSGPILGTCILFMSFFQGVGRAKEALLLSFARQGYVYIPLLFLCNALLGLNGIMIAQTFSDIIVLIGGYLCYRKFLGNCEKNG